MLSGMRQISMSGVTHTFFPMPSKSLDRFLNENQKAKELFDRFKYREAK
jgi:hypothetical protein